MGRIRGKATVISVSDAENSNTYVVVGQTTETDVFELQNNSEEVTTLADDIDQHEPTNQSFGDITFEIVYDNNLATHDGNTGIGYLAGAKAKRNWKITLSNGKEYIYRQFISNFRVNRVNAKNIARGTITLKHYGNPIQY